MIENNKLIAEFMGADIETPKEDDIIYMSIPMCNDLCLPNNCGAVKVRHLDYDESWDWLMPVVEKIESTNCGKYDGFFMTLTTNDIKIHGIKIMTQVFDEIISESNRDVNKMEFTYKAVVEFIKWYNEQK